jgi:hypothetical protein
MKIHIITDSNDGTIIAVYSTSIIQPPIDIAVEVERAYEKYILSKVTDKAKEAGWVKMDSHLEAKGITALGWGKDYSYTAS